MLKRIELFYKLALLCIVIIIATSTFTCVNGLTCPVAPTAPGKTELSYSVSGCEEREEKEYTRAKGVEQKVDVVIDDGSLRLTHHLTYVCCAKIKVYLDSLETYPDHTLIRIREKNEGEMCRCICDYEVNVKIGPLEKGRYRIQIFGIEFKDIPAEHLWEKEVEMDENIQS